MNNQAAREILYQQEQARVHLRGLQEEARALEQARDLALAHTPKATPRTDMRNPGRNGTRQHLLKGGPGHRPPGTDIITVY